MPWRDAPERVLATRPLPFVTPFVSAALAALPGRTGDCPPHGAPQQNSPLLEGPMPGGPPARAAALSLFRGLHFPSPARPAKALLGCPQTQIARSGTSGLAWGLSATFWVRSLQVHSARHFANRSSAAASELPPARSCTTASAYLLLHTHFSTTDFHNSLNVTPKTQGRLR
jgi:hypothetical protein